MHLECYYLFRSFVLKLECYWHAIPIFCPVLSDLDQVDTILIE